MFTTPFTAGVGIYVFYALQPYLLELWGDEEAYSIAGLAAVLVGLYLRAWMGSLRQAVDEVRSGKPPVRRYSMVVAGPRSAPPLASTMRATEASEAQ